MKIRNSTNSEEFHGLLFLGLSLLWFFTTPFLDEPVKSDAGTDMLRHEFRSVCAAALSRELLPMGML